MCTYTHVYVHMLYVCAHINVCVISSSLPVTPPGYMCAYVCAHIMCVCDLVFVWRDAEPPPLHIILYYYIIILK